MTMFRAGRRLFSTAAILMLLTAAVHTAGNLGTGPDTPEEQRVFGAMESLREPMGMGMNPSVRDIWWVLVLTMSITLAALGVLNLLLAGSEEVPDRVLRRVAWMNLAWVSVFLVLSWVEKVPPPLISAVLIEAFVLGSVWRLGRSTSRAM
jgi:hypothetical protein